MNKYKIIPLVGCALFVVCGLGLLVGGIRLAALGGSPFYVSAGIVLTIVGVAIARRDRRAGLLYGVFLAATLLWAVYEVGLDPWALLARIGVFVGLALWFVMPAAGRSLESGKGPSAGAYSKAPPVLAIAGQKSASRRGAGR